MTDRAANVRYEAIAKLEEALGSFARASLERLRIAETTLRRTTESLEDRRRDLRYEISQLRDEIASADPESDTSGARRRLEEAESSLAKVRAWQGRVEEAAQRYQREAQKLEQISSGTTIEAHAYLRRLLDDLAAYFALQHDGSSSARLSSLAGSSTISSSGMEQAQTTFDPTSFALPDGFRWVSVEEVDKSRLVDVQQDDAYKKASYAEMRRGFDALRDEILPLMNDSETPVDTSTFASRDAASGTPHEQGLQRVYEAFFGEASIYLSRGPNAGLFSINNGRHRIKVAMDAGWAAVPARTEP